MLNAIFTGFALFVAVVALALAAFTWMHVSRHETAAPRKLRTDLDELAADVDALRVSMNKRFGTLFGHKGGGRPVRDANGDLDPQDDELQALLDLQRAKSASPAG